MESEVIVDPLQDVTSLMNPLDEAEWHREGLFKQANSVELLSTFPSRLTYMFPHNTGINAPSLPYAPGSFSNPSPPPTFAFGDLVMDPRLIQAVYNNRFPLLLIFTIVEVTK
jgi:hypothetical protein